MRNLTVEQRNAVVAVLRDLYYDEGSAQAVLLQIGFPRAKIPIFRSAETFWPSVVLQLDNGVIINGVRELAGAASADHPDSEAARALPGLLGVRRPDSPRSPASGAGRGLRAVRVLGLFSDPLRESKTRIDREARLLGEIAERGGIDLQTRHAVRVADIIPAIRAAHPDILHFSGHGEQNGALVFEREGGGPASVSAVSFVQSIAAAMSRRLDCIVLNCCYSGRNATAFRTVSRTVAGSVAAIGDPCAVAFSGGFFTGIEAGEPPERAFESGCAQAGMESCDSSLLHFHDFGLDGDDGWAAHG